MPSTIIPTIPSESTLNTSNKSIISLSSDSIENENDEDETELIDSTSTMLSIGEQGLETQTGILSSLIKYQSPSTQRKRQRNTQTKIIEKNQEHPNKKTNSSITSVIKFTNFNENKKIKIKGDRSILSEDDSDDDFKEIRAKQNTNTKKKEMSFILTDDEDFSITEKKTQSLTFQPSITSTLSKTTQAKTIVCINCNFFICDLTSSCKNKINLNKLQIPSNLIDDFKKRFNCVNVIPLINDIDIAAFTSNTEIKKSNATEDQFINNSYIDINGTNCWQFIECNYCYQIIALTLKFTNSPELKNNLNKILVFCP